MSLRISSLIEIDLLIVFTPSVLLKLLQILRCKQKIIMYGYILIIPRPITHVWSCIDKYNTYIRFFTLHMITYENEIKIKSMLSDFLLSISTTISDQTKHHSWIWFAMSITLTYVMKLWNNKS